jgi:hypothetical protein
MTPVDSNSLGTDTPRTLDGRTYPDYLRPFEAHDQALLPLVISEDPITFDQLAEAITDPRLRAVLPQWLSSAEWRGLIERIDPTPRSPRQYRPGPYEPNWLTSD